MNKQKIDFRLEAKRQGDSTIVYLYGDIVDERPRDWWSGEEIEGDFIIPAEVRKVFDDIDTNNIDLHINSYGGSVFASVSIFNHIRALNKNITIYIDGLAASGASLIAMAGSKLIMPKNTTLMVHRASSFCWGNCNDMKKVAETLEKLDNATVFETYKAKFKGTDEELKSLIDTETWLSADECLENGFCDEVIELSNKEDKQAKTEEINNAIKFMSNFANLKLK
nr:MAG TPA: Putative ATP dependent Clp protease [Caudoviricetes sp.]